MLVQVHKALQEPEIIVGVWQAGMALRERQQMDEPTVLVGHAPNERGMGKPVPH